MKKTDKAILYFLKKASKKPRVIDDDTNSDCYSILIKKLDEGRNYYVNEYKSGIFTCKLSKHNEKEESKKMFLTEREIIKYEFEVTRRLKGYENNYKSSKKFLLNEVLSLIWPKYLANKIKHLVAQQSINRKNIETSSQIEVLKLVRKHDRKNNYNYPLTSYLFKTQTGKFINAETLLTSEHGANVAFRPDFRDKKKEIQLILDSLKEISYVKEDREHYQITGKGLNAIVKNEKENSRHKIEFTNKIFILILTLALAIGTLGQSGIVKFPTFLNLAN